MNAKYETDAKQKGDEVAQGNNNGGTKIKPSQMLGRRHPNPRGMGRMRIASAAQTLTEKPKMKEIQEKGRANREINMGRQAEWASESQTDRQRAPRRASATKSRAVARAINRIARLFP